VRHIVFTSRAREDLIDIWLFVAAHNSEAVADRIYDSIEQSCCLLSHHPLLGRARPESSRKRAPLSSSAGLPFIA
jgi:toxin ParE1/3/4